MALTQFSRLRAVLYKSPLSVVLQNRCGICLHHSASFVRHMHYSQSFVHFPKCFISVEVAGTTAYRRAPTYHRTHSLSERVTSHESNLESPTPLQHGKNHQCCPQWKYFLCIARLSYGLNSDRSSALGLDPLIDQHLAATESPQIINNSKKCVNAIPRNQKWYWPWSRFWHLKRL